MDFSIPAGDTAELLISLAATPEPGATAAWALYAASFANPAAAPLVVKAGILISPPQIAVPLVAADTAALLGNYIWIASVTDLSGDVTTVGFGVLTVTMSVATVANLAMLPAPPPYDARPFDAWMTPAVYLGVVPGGGNNAWLWQKAVGGPPFAPWS